MGSEVGGPQFSPEDWIVPLLCIAEFVHRGDVTSLGNVKLPAAPCQRRSNLRNGNLRNKKEEENSHRKTDRSATSHKTDRVVEGCDTTAPRTLSQDGSQGARRPIMCCFRAGGVGTLAGGRGGEEPLGFCSAPRRRSSREATHITEKFHTSRRETSTSFQPLDARHQANPDQQGTPSAALWLVDLIPPRGYCRRLI